MTNDQLTELSAKAIGLRLLDFTTDNGSRMIHPDDGGGWWNPLKSGNDVVRLIIELDAVIDADVNAAWCYRHHQGVVIDRQPHHTHKEAMAALRLAVTTLAARVAA